MFYFKSPCRFFAGLLESPRSRAAAIFLSFAFTASVGLAGSVPPPYQIGTWRGFRAAAISYTFDDDCPNQFNVAVPMFNARGFKMTLFTVVNWIPGGSWQKVTNAAAFGHEIASHTVTHPDLSTLAAALQTNELKNSQNLINANVPNQKCLTIAYPYCNEGTPSIMATYYIAGRTCSGQLVPSTPANFLTISSFVCGSVGSVKTVADFNNKAESAAAANAWCVYLIHAIDNDPGYSPLSSATLQGSLDYLSTNRNRLWVETFGNVVRYIRERNDASVTETSSNATRITLQVTDTLANSIYDYPISLRRPLPPNWPSASVSQNNAPVPTQFVTVNSTNYVVFDVVPDGGEVNLVRSALPPVLNNPGRNAATFDFRLVGQSNASYAISASSNLIDWSPIQTNTLAQTTYTNVSVPAPDPMQFYRAQWLP